MKKRKLFVGILMVSAVFGLAACDNTETNTTTTSGITSQVESKYTVKFMNGSSEINTQELVEGSSITAPADPVKESDNECDYVFFRLVYRRSWWNTIKFNYKSYFKYYILC